MLIYPTDFPIKLKHSLVTFFLPPPLLHTQWHERDFTRTQFPKLQTFFHLQVNYRL